MQVLKLGYFPFFNFFLNIQNHFFVIFKGNGEF
jgi:hypothetical protein